MSGTANGFTPAELDRSRAFHRPRHLALLANLALTALILGGLAQLCLHLAWWAGAIAAPALVDLALAAGRLPIGVWRHRQERRHGLSTQGLGGFAADTAKALAVGGALSIATFATLFALAHVWPGWWPLPAAAGAAFFVLAIGFLAPVVLEPIFNRFTPLADAELAARLLALAERAGAPVREVLVADASRRTTRRNAYVSGLGRTRRVVLWDTLLAEPQDEIALVLAHELGHRVHRHLLWLTGGGMLGLVAFVGLVRLVVPHPAPDDTAVILLLGLGCDLLALPFASALSRHFERQADRFSLQLTGDKAAYLGLHRRLALANLSELEPPLWLYYWFFSHPTPSQRLAAVETMS